MTNRLDHLFDKDSDGNKKTWGSKTAEKPSHLFTRRASDMTMWVHDLLEKAVNTAQDESTLTPAGLQDIDTDVGLQAVADTFDCALFLASAMDPGFIGRMFRAALGAIDDEKKREAIQLTTISHAMEVVDKAIAEEEAEGSESN